MSDGAVRCEVAGTVARITFDRREARNAMTWPMYDALLAALDQVDAAATVRVAILRGAGGHFVAGTDIGQFDAFTSGEDGVRYERRLESVVTHLEGIRVPTIAVVEGHAAGAGLLFATACDFRIATPDARFSAPIARTVGNTLSLASLARLVAHLGPGRTKALVMAATTLDAAEAHAAGFVSEVVPPAQLPQHVDALASRLAELAPLTLRATKALVARVVAAVGSDEDLLREVYGSRDFREGVNAFREKRPPSWEGR